MKPQFQTDTGRLTGNCFTASLASILDVPIESLPVPEPLQTIEEDDRDTSWYDLYNAWLRPRGMRMLSFPCGRDGWFPEGYSILLCRPNDIPHAVVALNGKPIWNPFPGYGERVGVLEPWEHWVIFQALNPSSVRLP